MGELLKTRFWGASACLAFASTLSIAEAPTETPHYQGILVAYSRSLSSSDRRKVLEIVQKEGFESTYYGDAIFAEAFAPTNSASLKLSDQLCEKLLQFSFVKNCDLDLRLEINEDVSDLAHGSPSQSSHPPSQTSRKKREDPCGLIDGGESPEKPGLSRYWAQSYIGRDIAHELFCQAPPSTSSGYALWDSAQHLKNVAFLMDDPVHGSRLGCPINRAKATARDYSKPGAIGKGQNHNAALLVYANEAAKRPERTVVNLSLRNIVDTTYSTFPKKDVFVVSAGNEWPISEKAKIRFKDGIFVGSTAPSGFPSDFSSSFENVCISAPSDNYIQSVETFSGTSGATPLVSGAVATLLDLLPGLSIADIKEMLTKTALPTPNRFAKDHANGNGTLNYPGLLSFAQRVKAACPIQNQNSLNCFHEKIHSLKASENHLNAKALGDAASAFGCGNPLNIRLSPPASCAQKKDLLRNLQRLAFLNPEVAPYWSLLSCIHKKLGYAEDAEFYRTLAFRNWPPQDPDAALKRLIREKIPRLTDTEVKSVGKIQASIELLRKAEDFNQSETLLALQPPDSTLLTEALEDSRLTASACSTIGSAMKAPSENKPFPLRVKQIFAEKTLQAWDANDPKSAKGEHLSQVLDQKLASSDRIFDTLSKHTSSSDPLRTEVLDFLTSSHDSSAALVALGRRFIENSPKDQDSMKSAAALANRFQDLAPVVVAKFEAWAKNEIPGEMIVPLGNIPARSPELRAKLTVLAEKGFERGGWLDPLYAIDSMLNIYKNWGAPPDADRLRLLRKLRSYRLSPQDFGEERRKEYQPKLKKIIEILSKNP